MRLNVMQGNCPCVIKPARELGLEDMGDCQAGASCRIADLLSDVGGLDEAAVGCSASQESDLGRLRIDLRLFDGLYGGDIGDIFLLVASPDVRAAITLVGSAGVDVEEIAWHPGARAEVIGTLAALRAEGKRCSVLWIASDEFEHYLEDDITNAKVAAISFFSHPFSTISLARYLQIIKNSQFERELQIEQHLFTLLEQAKRVILEAPAFDTRMTFDHHDAEHWFSLHGPLQFGQQTVLPTGELAALTDASGDFDFRSRFSITGTHVLCGQPILHRGSREVTAEETARVFEALTSMQHHAVVAYIEDGVIQELRSPTSGDNPLLRTMSAVFDTDERYRKVHEMGFGTNVGCLDMTRDNLFANERWPGLHCGLGLGGYTPFHIDMACTEIKVLLETPDGDLVDMYRALGLPHRLSGG